MKKNKVMASYDVGHEISLLCGHILRLAGKSESDVGGVRLQLPFEEFEDVRFMSLLNRAASP